MAQSPQDLDDVRLGPGDQLRIEVVTEPNLSGQYTLDDQGRALLPVAGFLLVGGRPFGDVRDDVERRYAEELIDPVIRVTPLFRVAVLGEVRAPGLLPVDPTFSIADVIATAGGLMPTASWSQIALYRGGEVVKTRLEPESRTLDLPLRSGDQIVVGRRSWFSENGAVFVGAAASVFAAAVTALIVR